MVIYESKGELVMPRSFCVYSRCFSFQFPREPWGDWKPKHLLKPVEWWNRHRGKQWSVFKCVTVTLYTDEKRILNVPCIQTYNCKEKLAVLMVARIKGSTKDQKFNLEARWDSFGAHYKGEYVIYSLEYFQNQFPELYAAASLVLKTWCSVWS